MEGSGPWPCPPSGRRRGGWCCSPTSTAGPRSSGHSGGEAGQVRRTGALLSLPLGVWWWEVPQALAGSWRQGGPQFISQGNRGDGAVSLGAVGWVLWGHSEVYPGVLVCQNGLESKPLTLLDLGWPLPRGPGPGPLLSHLRLQGAWEGVSGPRETVMGHPACWLQVRPREWGPLMSPENTMILRPVSD